MAFEIIVFHVHSNFTLGDAWCGKVGGAFDEIHLCKDFIVAYEPCQSHARSQCLGEGAGIDDEVLRIHRNERSDFFAFKAQVAVRVIFEYRDFILGNDFHKFLAAFQGPADTGRVLVVRDDVDEFDFVGCCENLVQFFRDHALIIGRNFDEFRLFESECTDSAQVGRAFNENDIVLVDEYASGDVKTLLGASGDHDVLRIDFIHAHRTIHTVHAVGNSLAKSHETEGRAVLHSAGAVFFSDFDCNFSQFFQRKCSRSWETAGKGNNVRLSGKSQQWTKVGAFHLRQYFRKVNSHNNLSFTLQN